MPEETPSKKPWLTRLARFASGSGVAVLALLVLLASASRLHWFAGLVATLRWQLGLAGLAVLVPACLARRPGHVLLALVLSGLLLGPGILVRFGAPECALSGSLRVAAANLEFERNDPAPFQTWVREDGPDVVGLAEVTAFWRGAAEELRASHPHQVFAPVDPEHRFSFGLGLLSRWPVLSSRVESVPEAAAAGVRDEFLEARLDAPGGVLHVVVVHAPRPGGAERTLLRDAYLEHVAATVEWTERSVLLGDFNATGTSPVFRRVLERSGLADSRRGFGRSPTWRTSRRIPPLPGDLHRLAWLDLDHVLVGEAFAVSQRSVGPTIGSDHLPAVAELCPAAP